MGGLGKMGFGIKGRNCLIPGSSHEKHRRITLGSPPKEPSHASPSSMTSNTDLGRNPYRWELLFVAIAAGIAIAVMVSGYRI
jgi:hypothetical protein